MLRLAVLCCALVRCSASYCGVLCLVVVWCDVVWFGVM